MNKYLEKFCWDNYNHLVSQYDKLYQENKELKEENKKLKQLLKYCFEEGLIGE